VLHFPAAGLVGSRNWFWKGNASSRKVGTEFVSPENSQSRFIIMFASYMIFRVHKTEKRDGRTSSGNETDRLVIAPCYFSYLICHGTQDNMRDETFGRIF
jgi:hypothetical protein